MAKLEKYFELDIAIYAENNSGSFSWIGFLFGLGILVEEVGDNYIHHRK